MNPATLPRLQIHLLGGFSVTLDGAAVVGFRSAKVRALLAYLAVESGRAHRRDTLATLLWGEYPQHDAQRSLRQALANLRTLLAPLSAARTEAGISGEAGPTAGRPEPILVVTGQDVELVRDPDLVWVDVHAFDALLAVAGPRRASTIEARNAAELLAQAVELYHGPFLAGLSLPDSQGFEEWRLLEEERRHHEALQSLEWLAGHYLAESRTEEVQRFARRQLALEPWNEGAHQSLMLALALSGQRAAALRQYEACRRVVAEELGVEPAAETAALRRQIRDGSWSDLAEQARSAAGGSAGAVAFVAREGELARLEGFLDLAFAGQGRVALVRGEAGTGKTALLAHFARRAVTTHRRLVASAGRCSAFAGTGDPLLPFREIFQGLCGAAGTVDFGYDRNPDHARRLWALFPAAAQVLVEAGPDLIGRLVPVEVLLARAETLAPAGVPWLSRLGELKRRARQPSPRGGMGPTAAPAQQALFEQVTRVLQALARQHPLLLLLDDLQWADAASLSLLFHLGRQLAGSRILVLAAYRPSEVAAPPSPIAEEGESQALVSLTGRTQTGGVRHPLPAIAYEFRRQWGDVEVDLDQAGGRRFVDALLDSEPNRLGDPFREMLTRHTAGLALFTVELLHSFREWGELVRDDEGRWVEGAALHGEALPPRVEAVIAKRVARLPAEWRRVLEAAAVVGESFGAEIVARALGVDAAWVRELLSGPLSAECRLVQPLGVQRLAEGSELLSRYRFGHALVHEYVVSQLDAVQRARLHGQVGAALESACGEQEAALALVSAQLARHYEQAGDAGKSAGFLLLAGRQATRLAAYEEAATLYRRGLALLEETPDSRERSRRQIELYLALDVSLVQVFGWGASERAAVLSRARTIALRLGEPEPLMRVLLFLMDFHTSLGKVGPTLESSEDLLRLAELERDPFYLAVAHLAAGMCYMHLGRMAAGREHLEQALALGTGTGARLQPRLQAEQRALRPALFPVTAADLTVASVAWLSFGLAVMGYADQARARSRQALALLAELADPPAAVLVTAGAAFHAMLRDAVGARTHAERLRDIAKRHSLEFTSGWVQFYLGWAQAQTGEPDAGLAAMHAGLTTVQRGGMLGFRPHLHCLAAETLLAAGRAQEGLDLVAAAGPHAGPFVEPEVLRLRGQLLLFGRPDRADEAEACFRRALEAARSHETHLFELRAAVCLARLWRTQGRRDEAYDLLAGVYGWFSEGFDTVDLVEAKALLEEIDSEMPPGEGTSATGI